MLVDRLETELRVMELQLRLLAELESRAAAPELEDAARELRKGPMELAALYNDYAARFQVGLSPDPGACGKPSLHHHGPSCGITMTQWVLVQLLWDTQILPCGGAMCGTPSRMLQPLVQHPPPRAADTPDRSRSRSSTRHRPR